MKLNKFVIVSILLLAMISFGTATAVSDNITADDDVVNENNEVTMTSSYIDDNITGEDIASDDIEIEDSKLGVSADEDKVSTGTVTPSLTINVSDINYGQSIVITTKINNATGNITYTANGKSYTGALVDGVFTQEITDYVLNSNKITVAYSGDDYYKSSSTYKYVYARITSSIIGNSADFGQIAFIDANLYNATGNLTFTLNGINYVQNLVNGTVIQEFTNYTLGSNTVSVVYSGDDKFNSFSSSVKFTTTANIDAPTIYNYQDAIITVNLGDATGSVNITMGDENYTVDLVNGVATQKLNNYTIGDNKVTVVYSGDDTFNGFSTTKTFTVLDKENATILSSVYKTANKNIIAICIPHGTGTINATINGKKEILELTDGMVLYNISASDVITEITVYYDGNTRLNPANTTVFKKLENIVTEDNYIYYFNQGDGGKLFDFIDNGTTLDFQGSIINTNQSKNVYFDVNKPVNIVSTTHDAYIDLNTTAGSLIGENPGNRFTISYNGSWTNMTGISFHNTQLWLFNTHHVVLDNVSNVIEDQRVGSGVGATSIRANSTWVTVKNSYFYTRNNGGSSSLVIAWADYCTFDNNTIVVEGNVGNMIYLTTYNVDIPSGVIPNKYNNITNNKIYGPEKSAAICWAMVVYGFENLFANNYINYSGVGMTIQWGASGVLNNTYANNTLVGGASAALPGGSIAYDNYVSGTFSTSTDSIVYNNTVLKVMTVGARSEVYNNTVAGFTLSGADALVHDNTVNGATTISAAGTQIYNNSFIGENTIKFSNANAKNIIFADNNVIGNIVFSNANAKNDTIINNIITTSSNYAVDLGTYTNTGNNVSYNYLTSAKGYGNNAVNYVEDETITVNNYQNETAGISVEVADIKVGQNAVFNVTTDVTSLSSAVILVNSKSYSVNLTNGKGSVEVSDLLSGSYDVIVLSTDETYAAKNTTSLTVSKNNCPEINVVVPEITQWIESSITVTINDATGTVTLTVNGTDVSAELVNGVASLTIPDLVYGNYNYTITYSGDYKYLGNTTNGNLTVNKNKEVKIVAEDIYTEKYLDAFSVKFTDYIGEAIANANVTISVNGETYNLITDENGTATANVSLLKGKYVVDVLFKAIENEYDAQTANYTIIIIDETIMKIVSIEGDCIITGSLYDALLQPMANVTIHCTMNGTNYNVTTDDNGLFKFQATNGYKVLFEFYGDEVNIYSSASITLNDVAHVMIDSVLSLSSVKIAAVDTAAGEKGSTYSFILKDAQGNLLSNKTVSVILNGKVYTVKTNNDGKASLSTSLNAAKTYAINVFFIGDDDYKGTSASANIQVVKKSTSIKVAKSKYKFKAKAKTKVIKATLKTNNKYLSAGKKVTIKIKGKTYTAKTGKKGAIKLKIKKLTKKGTYKAKIKFAGDSTYKASTSKKIKIILK